MSQYDASDTKFNDCKTCHTLYGGSARNPYGQDLEAQFYPDRNVFDTNRIISALTAIEGKDSDEDKFTNIVEIRARTFPGNSGDFPICTDNDNDGYYAENICGTTVDCEDTNSNIYPGGLELCDEVDNNCDEVIDEDCVDVNIEPIITDLNNPVAITNADDDSNRLFITLQDGRIIIYDGTQTLPTPFLDIRSLVSCCEERGLLSVAFHPNFKNNDYFYVNYTNSDGDTVITRYTVSDDPNIADTDSALILLTITQPYSNHNGGQIKFGPDGYLYIGMGDGGSGGDPQNYAQNMGTLLGKLLRIDIDNGSPYAIPPDNPFRDTLEARDEIWAFGLRNPWRFSFDRMFGDLFIGDVGQSEWEEVHFQSNESQGGENYGWRLMEGNHCFDPPDNCNEGTLTLPIIEYNHSMGCSITGGYIYRGARMAKLFGTYLYGDYCSGLIWGAVKDGNANWSTTELLDTDFLISAFGESEDGEIYFAHYNPINGTIYRIFTQLMKGDVNGDGNITPQDALMAFQHYLELIQLDAPLRDRAEVTGDGAVTPADALCIFQKYLGLSSCLDE